MTGSEPPENSHSSPYESVGVVGGGAVGITAAASLARRGVGVTLYERGELAGGSTGRAAGLCYDAFADERDARHAAHSLDRFRDLGVLTDVPYVWFVREGHGDVAGALREQVQQMQRNDRAVTRLSPAELAARFPALRTGDISCAAITHNAGSVDTVAYVDRVATWAREAGAAIRTETPVRLTTGPAVETPDGTVEHDAVLVAAGAHTARLLDAVGVPLALGLYRVQALVAEAERSGAGPSGVPMCYDATERWYARPAEGGLLAGDGAHAYDGPPSSFDRDADGAFVSETCDRLRRRFEGTVTPSRSWAGLCTATPDRDPLVGECTPGVYVAAGWHGHGFMRAPAMGELVAEVICDGHALPAFDPGRFDGTEAVDVPGGVVE